MRQITIAFPAQYIERGAGEYPLTKIVMSGDIFVVINREFSPAALTRLHYEMEKVEEARSGDDRDAGALESAMNYPDLQ